MDEAQHLNPDVSALIAKIGIPAVIRAITAHCYAEYERRRRILYERNRERFPEGEPYEDDEPPAPEDVRRERDETSALLGMNINFAADNYEEQLRKAGWTRKQKCEDERAAEIAKKKAELERLQKIECA